MPGFPFRPDQLPRIEITSPAELSKERWPEIQTLRFLYYLTCMGGRSDDEVQGFVNQTTKQTWDDPNTAAGSRLTRAGQEFAHPRVVAAFSRDNDELLGYVYAADNVSSAQPPKSRRAKLERGAKMHLPVLGKRYRAIRETVGPDSAPLTLPVMTAAAVVDAGMGPVTAYPLNTERTQQILLGAGGLAFDESFPRVPIFSYVDSPAIMKMSAPHAQDVVDRLVGEKGDPIRDFVDMLAA